MSNSHSGNLVDSNYWGADPYSNDPKWNETQLRRALIILLDQVTQGSDFGYSKPLSVAVNNAFAVLSGDASIDPETMDL